MNLIRCAGAPVLEARITLPVCGRGVFTLELDAEEAPTGAVTVTDKVATYQVAILRSGIVGSSCRLEAVAGAGGLGDLVLARSYQVCPARRVVEELLEAVGERLDSSSTASVLASPLPYWTRAAGVAKDALTELATVLGARWRVLPSGAVWFGQDTWPAASAVVEALELDRDDAAGTVELAPENLALTPGVVFQGRRVGRVEYLVTRDEPLRTTFWVEP